jgi:hypothetical protein
MKERTVKIKADVGERVRVPTLECTAVIIALYVGAHATTYEIAYFHDGDRKTCYLYDHEFEVRP